MTDYLGMVKEFHTKHGRYTPSKPHSRLNIPQEVMLLTDRLIAEEIDEFASAVSPTDIADALGDILYVVFGAALAYGIPINEVFAEIHRSNMTKSILKDEFGKILKEGYEPARIGMILQGMSQDVKPCLNPDYCGTGDGETLCENCENAITS